MKRKRVIILGCTGSIGRSTVDVVCAHPDRFEVVGLAANKNAALLRETAARFPDAKTAVVQAPPTGSRTCSDFHYTGERAAERLVQSVPADIVMNGIAGAAGLRPSIRTLEVGADLALANKETAIMAGGLIRERSHESESTILPVDSEHSAVFHLLRTVPERFVDRIVLTASGGAFRDTPLAELENVTVDDALAHPTWDMGAKITVDSATMANKAMEVMEASVLFDVPVDTIDVVIHPQSRAHSFIRTVEGSLYAQISEPDMRVPIQNALTFPELAPCPFGGLDLNDCTLTFYEPDLRKYPLLEVGRGAGRRGGQYPIAFNAANEVAVADFIRGRIGFTDIAKVVERCLQADWSRPIGSFDDVFETDIKARRLARETITTIL